MDECEAQGVRITSIINGKPYTELIKFTPTLQVNDLVLMATKLINENPHPVIEKLNSQLLIEKEKNRQLEQEKTLLELENEPHKSEASSSSSTHPIQDFISKYCETGEDSKTDRYQVFLEDLYASYKEHGYPFISYVDFNKYVRDTLGFTRRVINVFHVTHNTRCTGENHSSCNSIR